MKKVALLWHDTEPIGICVFSYNGSVAVGVSGDSRMIPDPDHISRGVGQHVERLLAAATAHTASTSTPALAMNSALPTSAPTSPQGA